MHLNSRARSLRSGITERARAVRAHYLAWASIMTFAGVFLIVTGAPFAGSVFILATAALLGERVKSYRAFKLGFLLGYESRDYGLPYEDPGHVDDAVARQQDLDT